MNAPTSQLPENSGPGWRVTIGLTIAVISLAIWVRVLIGQRDLKPENQPTKGTLIMGDDGALRCVCPKGEP